MSMLDIELMKDELDRRASAWGDGFRRAAADRVREAAGDLLARILAEHPVASGESRAGWYPAAEALGISFTPAGREQAVALGRAQGAGGLELGGDDPAVVMINGVVYRRIDDRGLHIAAGGEEKRLPVDHVVICTGQLSCRDLEADLQAAGVRTHLIGGAERAAELDAKRAIEQGFRLALSL